MVTLKGITGGFKVAKQAIINLSNKIIPKSKLICEPNLGKRNLYALISNKNQHHKLSRKLLNFLIYADGKNEIKDISKIIKLTKVETYKIYKLLKKYNILI